MKLDVLGLHVERFTQPLLNAALGKAIGVYVEQTFATESSSVAKDLPEVFQRFAAANFVDPSEVQPDYHG